MGSDVVRLGPMGSDWVISHTLNTLLHKWCQDTSVPGRFGPETFPHHQTGAEVSRQFGTSLANTLALVPKCLVLQQTLLLQLAVQKEGLILLVIIKEDHRFYSCTQEYTAEDGLATSLLHSRESLRNRYSAL